MIQKTIDGYEITVHPSMEQAAMDQGIRPAGYYAPNTGWSRLSTDQLFDLHKGIHDRAVKDTVDKVIEIIHRRQEEREQLQDKGDWDNGYLTALDALECEVMVMEGTE